MNSIPIILILILPFICIILLRARSKYFTDAFLELSVGICLFVSAVCIGYLLLFWSKEVFYLQSKFTSGKIIVENLIDEESLEYYKKPYFIPDNNNTKYIIHLILISLFVYGNLSIGYIIQKLNNTFFKTESGDTKRWIKKKKL